MEGNRSKRWVMGSSTQGIGKDNREIAALAAKLAGKHAYLSATSHIANVFIVV
jgi:hypothetical protein